MARRLSRAIVRTLLVLATAGAAVPALADEALKAAVAGSARSAQNVARDGARHPYETLTFWGVKPGQTIVELQPGGGYWLEILAPYAKATNGQYVATAPDLKDPKLPEQARTGRAAFEAKYADAARFGTIRYADWGPNAASLGPAGSADIVITARNIHNWMWTPGELDRVMAASAAVLKPGGILAVEEHRADPRAEVPEARDGYVATATVIAAAEKAGFKLDAQSEVNANPKDTKDHPFGVWTLPPTNMKSFSPRLVSWPGRPINGVYDPAKHQAVGESDRMTLRFRKAQ